MMSLGPKGAALIKSFEQYRDKSYQDQRGIWTCGWGHTGPDVKADTVCTPALADAWFFNDTHTAVNAVLRAIDVPMTQNQFDALCSICFNIGAHAFETSTLVRVLNAGNYMAAADQFLAWDHTNGQVNAGLSRRREAEHALFLST